MEIAFTDRPGGSKNSLPTGRVCWPFYYERTQLYATLQQAATRSNCEGHETLASFVFPIEQCDALLFLRAFQQLQLGESLFWEQPAESRAMVGAGVAATIEINGSARFSLATTAWHVLQRESIVHYAPNATPGLGGPILIGGFSFDPLYPRTTLWEGFPDGLLIMPTFFFHAQGPHASFTINQLVPIGADIDTLIDSLATTLQGLQYCVGQLFAQPTPTPGRHRLITHNMLAPHEWQQIIAKAVRSIQEGAYRKVVFARGVEVALHPPIGAFDIVTILSHLRQCYPAAYLFSLQRGKRYFCGATPELLARTQNGYIRTMALAGSSPRGTTEVDDQIISTQLLHSEKQLEEHAFVVTMISETLQSICTSVEHDGVPHLLQLKNIQHLITPIIGRLFPEMSILDVIAALHPTPAVGGVPRQEALKMIRKEERLDRGWYAGPIGWFDFQGNGDFVVALRSALLDERRAVLFAGCGIVADSRIEEEYQESCWKLQVMMNSLRICSETCKQASVK